MTTGKTIALTILTFVSKVMSLLFNMLSRFIIGEGNGNPLQCSCLENPRDGGAWWAAVYLTLSDPMDCSPPGSSIHGIFQARVLEWGAIALTDTTEVT